MLLEYGVDVTVIVGYRHEDVRQALEGLPVHFVFNPFFDVTNSIGSLWMAREGLMEEDTIIANADVFWGREIEGVGLICALISMSPPVLMPPSIPPQ